MAYKFQMGPAVMSGSLVQEGAGSFSSLDAGAGGLANAGAIAGATTIDASGDLTVGSITNAEFTVDASGNTDIDGTLNVEGIPTFQAAAVFSAGISAAGSIAGATSIDGSGDLTMGTITMPGFAVDADGDIAAKSLAVDNSSTIGCDADADLMTLAAQSIIIAADAALTYKGGAITSTGAELNLVDGSGAGSIVASKAVIYDALGAVNANALSGTLEYMLDVAANGGIGMTPFNNAANVADLKISASYFAAEAVAVAADSFMFFDADGSVKKESLADYATAIAGSGLAAASGVLSVDLNEAAAGVVDLAADSFTFIDANDSNAVKKDSYVDYAALAAGVGLSAASGVFALDLNELGAAAIAAGDSLAFIDATDSNNSKKETVDDLAALFAGNGLSAASAVMALDLNELSAAAVDVANDSIAIVDATDSSSKKESIVDLVAAMAGTGLTATAGTLNLSSTGGVAAIGDANATLAEGTNYGNATLTADRTWTLPASVGMAVGDSVRVKAPADVGDFKIIIAKAGSQTIDGYVAVELEADNAALTLIYAAADTWIIV